MSSRETPYGGGPRVSFVFSNIEIIRSFAASRDIINSDGTKGILLIRDSTILGNLKRSIEPSAAGATVFAGSLGICSLNGSKGNPSAGLLLIGSILMLTSSSGLFSKTLAATSGPNRSATVPSTDSGLGHTVSISILMVGCSTSGVGSEVCRFVNGIVAPKESSISSLAILIDSAIMPLPLLKPSETTFFTSSSVSAFKRSRICPYIGLNSTSTSCKASISSLYGNK